MAAAREHATGWTVDTDVVIVGSGIAGLTTALHLTRHSSLRVLLVTKDVLSAGSTRWAQGGIAAALGAGDSPDQHFPDTIVAGPACATRQPCDCSCGKDPPRCAISPSSARDSTAARTAGCR